MLENSMLKTITVTSLALIAFAANSVLCRLALGNTAIDAASFTILRLLSGTTVLLILVFASGKVAPPSSTGSWSASFMLFLYAVTFSFAYNSLDTATGALILFASVQITMILLSLVAGNRLHFSEWIGVVLAFSGFVYLILPDVTTPSGIGFLLMSVAGIAWGIYTLKGHGSKYPLVDTAYNFLRTTPLVVVLAIITVGTSKYSAEGILLAAVSGGITSGIGYTMWYIALADLSSTQAAVLQLSVPVIAALDGIVFVSEAITSRLILSSAVILGGILIVVTSRYYFTRDRVGSR
jgi:drug/metabolite transporter (DMT)-like permease